MTEVIINPFEGCTLIITGEYYKAEPEVNYAAQFEINTIKSKKNSCIIDLLEWATGTNVDYLRYIEELVIQKIEEK